METGKLFEKTRSISKLMFLIPLTIILLAFAVFLSPFMTKGFVEGTGIVTGSEKVVSYDADNMEQITYDTDVLYTVDGKNYTATFSLGEAKAIGSVLTIYYSPENPQRASDSMNNGWLWLIFIALGLASGVFMVYTARKDSKRQKETAALRAQRAEAQKNAVTYEEGDLNEYYFRFDGHTFKPGYLLEDAARALLFEGKMLKNNPFAPREYEFIDHRTQRSAIHKVSHTVTSGSGSEFSDTSYFKFDGVNIWDYLHGKGVLIESDLGGKLRMTYTITKNGSFLFVVVAEIYVVELDGAVGWRHGNRCLC